MRRKQVRVGDVLEVRAGDRFAYMQYIGKHAEYGDAVLVSPRLHEPRATVTSDLISGAYVTFYPVTVAVAQQLVEVVGHQESPGLPKRFRRRGAMSGRRVLKWIIEGSGSEQVKESLKEDELHLPIAAIWNHEFLVQRILEGWNPAQEGRESCDDARPVSEIGAASEVAESISVLHYLYVPNSGAARIVAAELERHGFTTEERLGGDGTNWLVLARHVVAPTKELLDSLRESMERLVAPLGGEYDGWEADVRK